MCEKGMKREGTRIEGGRDKVRRETKMKKSE